MVSVVMEETALVSIYDTYLPDTEGFGSWDTVVSLTKAKNLIAKANDLNTVSVSSGILRPL